MNYDSPAMWDRLRARLAVLDGEPFFSWDLNARIHRGLDFTCPTCQKSMYPAIGPIRVWHFKHKTRSSCPGGGESELHYKMKHWFFTQAKKYGFRVEVEELIRGDIHHKPDVLIYLDDEDAQKYHCLGVAIEFQNSTLQVSEYRERNLTYLSQGYTPWWVFGGKNYDYYQRQLKKTEQRIRSTEQLVLEDIKKIHYLTNSHLFEVIFRNIDAVRKTNGRYYKTDVNFVSALNYILGDTFLDKNVPFEKYSDRKCGFFVVLDGKWTSIPRFHQYRYEQLKKELKIIRENFELARTKTSSLKKRAINMLEIIDVNLNFNKYSRIFLSQRKGRPYISRSRAIDLLVHSGLSINSSLLILELMVKRKKIIRDGRGFRVPIQKIDRLPPPARAHAPPVRTKSDSDLEKISRWRRNWGRNGKFTKPIER